MSSQHPHGYSMAPTYESGLEAAPPAGLEPAPQNFPELAYQHHRQPLDSSHGYPQPYADVPLPYSKPAASPSTISPYSSPAAAAAAAHAAPPPAPTKSRTVCGCSLLVFTLSCIIALLAAAVIGLAAGTGIESQRANDATNRLATASAVLAAVTATPTGSGGTSPTGVAAGAIDEGCATDPEGVTGSVYQSFGLLGGLKFTKYCNRDTKFSPIMSLFTSSFSTCMDACASYTRYVPPNFGRGDNSSCGAVSFIPLWTTKSVALAGGAPGNCYLKSPQNESQLSIPNIGTPCHAAIWNPGA